MDYRLRLPSALVRVLRSRHGPRVDEGLRRLAELWAAERVDPLAAGDPIATARGAQGGRIAAERMTATARRERAQLAAAARWKDHRDPASSE